MNTSKAIHFLIEKENDAFFKYHDMFSILKR